MNKRKTIQALLFLSLSFGASGLFAEIFHATNESKFPRRFKVYPFRFCGIGGDTIPAKKDGIAGELTANWGWCAINRVELFGLTVGQLKDKSLDEVKDVALDFLGHDLAESIKKEVNELPDAKRNEYTERYKRRLKTEGFTEAQLKGFTLTELAGLIIAMRTTIYTDKTENSGTRCFLHIYPEGLSQFDGAAGDKMTAQEVWGMANQTAGAILGGLGGDK